MLSDRYKGWIKRISDKLSWINPFKVKKNANGTIVFDHKPFILNITNFLGLISLAACIYLINVFRANKPGLWGLTKADADRIGWDELGPALETAHFFKAAEIFYKGFWQKIYKYIVIPLLLTTIWGIINNIYTRNKSALRIMAKQTLEPSKTNLFNKLTKNLSDFTISVQKDTIEKAATDFYHEEPFSSPKTPQTKIRNREIQPTSDKLNPEAIKLLCKEYHQSDLIEITSTWEEALKNANENKFGFEYWKYFSFFREDNHNAAQKKVNFPGRGMLNILFPLAITFIPEWIIKKGVNECCQKFEVIYNRFLHDPNINWKNHKLLAIEAYGEAGKEIWTFTEFKSVILYCLVPLSILAGISFFGILATYGINRIRAYYQNGKEETLEIIPGRKGYYRISENEPLLTFKT